MFIKEFLREGYAPVVVTADDKEKYIDLLARQDVSSLASFICKLSEKEVLRNMINGIYYDICMTQSRIYRYVAQYGYEVKRFSDAFLASDFCKRAFDTIYSRFQLEDVLSVWIL